jgi:hypothetical protein
MTKYRRLEWCLILGHRYLDQSDWTDWEKWYGRTGQFYHGDNPPCTKCGVHKQGFSTWSWYLGYRWRQFVWMRIRFKVLVSRPFMRWLWVKCGHDSKYVVAWHDSTNKWHRLYKRLYRYIHEFKEIN